MQGREGREGEGQWNEYKVEEMDSNGGRGRGAGGRGRGWDRGEEKGGRGRGKGEGEVGKFPRGTGRQEEGDGGNERGDGEGQEGEGRLTRRSHTSGTVELYGIIKNMHVVDIQKSRQELLERTCIRAVD